ncbi:hypothetical protein Pst134EA_011867 [Puccinia striiformis f. sp. tritici]|nr:hypothetical protein Pst134EA_011867 [Puccinia striiformis f. sp. tritici]KAH9468241.1 hypothetical protein Pst134EA_011867 [Puccinia striiformis f. sp. tritici]
MIQPSLFQQTDYSKIKVEVIEGFVAKLKQDPSIKDNLDILSISGWIVNGWKYIEENSGRLDEDLVESTELTSITQFTRFATVWARLTRDLVAGVKSYQDALRPTIFHIINILWLTSAVARLDHPSFKAFNQFSVQALSNLNTLNHRSISDTWPELIDCDNRKSILLRLLHTKNNRLLLIIGVLILNCVHRSSARIESLINSTVGKKVMMMLLERLDGLLDDETDVVFEVIVNLIREIINVEPISQVPKLYESQATPSQVLSPSQLSILKVIESSKTDLLPSTAFLLQEFKRLSNRLDLAWQGFVLVIEIWVKLIEKMIASPIPTVDLESIDLADISCVIEISIRILKELTEKRSELTLSKTAQPSKGGGGKEGDKKRSINQIMIGLIKLLTNLIELHSSSSSSDLLDQSTHLSNGGTFIQDQVRNLNGFPIILNFTKFDVDFPYLSEHSIVLIKFLLKNNPENQEIIKNLKPLNLPL